MAVLLGPHLFPLWSDPGPCSKASSIQTVTSSGSTPRTYCIPGGEGSGTSIGDLVSATKSCAVRVVSFPVLQTHRTGHTASLQKDKHMSPEGTGFSKPH